MHVISFFIFAFFSMAESELASGRAERGGHAETEKKLSSETLVNAATGYDSSTTPSPVPCLLHPRLQTFPSITFVNGSGHYCAVHDGNVRI